MLMSPVHFMEFFSYVRAAVRLTSTSSTPLSLSLSGLTSSLLVSEHSGGEQDYLNLYRHVLCPTVLASGVHWPLTQSWPHYHIRTVKILVGVRGQHDGSAPFPCWFPLGFYSRKWDLRSWACFAAGMCMNCPSDYWLDHSITSGITRYFSL
jgi:hypothetical protein